MTPPTPTRLHVEIDHDGHGIAGQVSSDAAGPAIDFMGWLGLAAAIEELAAAAAQLRTSGGLRPPA
jgi:hypothetical protein